MAVRTGADKGLPLFTIYTPFQQVFCTGIAFKGLRCFKVARNEEDDSTKRLMQELRSRLENSLKRLGTDRVELYYQHRVNKDIPVEDIAKLQQLIKSDK